MVGEYFFFFFFFLRIADLVNKQMCVAERKNFKLLFSAGISSADEVSILYFRPMRII